MATDPAWYRYAACQGKPTDWWYPDDTRDNGPAISVCHDCPARTGCLEHALTHHETEGIWGGTTPRQRRTLTHQRNRLRRDEVS